MSLAGTLHSFYRRSGLQRVVPMRAKLALRKPWVRAARTVGYPISSSIVPRPPLDPGRRCIRLSHVVLASDLNTGYLDYWAPASRAWAEIAELEPVLVVIGDEESAPSALRSDERVRFFSPLDGVHSAFQAQCIRLLYPALVETRGGVLISDIDMVPLNPGYFHRPVAKVDDRFFVAYRDLMLSKREIPLSYNAARPETWGEIFGIESEDDIRDRLAGWAERVEYSGHRGGVGWNTDQRVLHDEVMAWGETTRRLWMLDDDYCGYRRLDRIHLVHEDGLEPHRKRALESMRYSDYNAPVPYGDYSELTGLVLELGLEAAARARGRHPARVS